MEAICLDVVYEAGSFSLHSGVKCNVKSSRRGDTRFENRGTGWGQTTTGSKLILKVKLEKGDCSDAWLDNYFKKYGEYADVWIDHYFKENIGRLTEKRQNLIKRFMPESVELTAMPKQDGSVYFTVSDIDYDAWYNRLQPYL